MTTDKQNIYDEILPQLQSLLQGETEEMSVLANAAALLHQTFHWWWTGFYLVRPVAGYTPDEELRLGPFQGPVACMHIGRGRGVCGAAWERKATIVVDDVETFPGHIACSSETRSEIVVPLTDSRGEVVGVLDIDSEHYATFDETDKQNLERAADIISGLLYR